MTRYKISKSSKNRRFNMNDKKRLSQEEVILLFEQEFFPIRDKFIKPIINIQLKAAGENKAVSVNEAGIYIHWRSDLGVIKVGKSQVNSKKRALEHITDNTHNSHFEMRHLQDDENARLILFNISDKKDIHWLLSVEAFMEWNSNPLIPSKRIG